MAEYSNLERTKIRIRMCLTPPRGATISRLEFERWPARDEKYDGTSIRHFVSYGDGQYFEVVLRKPDASDILLHQAWSELDEAWMKEAPSTPA